MHPHLKTNNLCLVGAHLLKFTQSHLKMEKDGEYINFHINFSCV